MSTLEFWTRYHLENGYYDEGGVHHACATKADAQRVAARTARDERAYYAAEFVPSDSDGFDDDDFDGGRRSDADGRL